MADEIMEQSNSSNQIKNKISELLEENMTLRETLKENNTSIKELFENVTKWQDDMMNTHVLHKNKFSETKEYVERVFARFCLF